MEKVTLVGEKRYGPKYAFIKFKHSISVPYTLQLMNGIRLYDQPLRLKARNGPGNTGSADAMTPPQSPMGPPPPLMPPSLHAAHQPPVLMRPASLMAFNHNSSGAHSGLLRSSSEPGGLGAADTDWRDSRRTGNTARDRERSAGPYSRPHTHQRPSQPMPAQNITPQWRLQTRTVAMSQQNPQFSARTPHVSAYRQQNHHSHMQFNDRSGYRRR